MPTPPLDSILTPEFAEFARLLTSNGFKVYVFKSEIARIERGGRESSVTHLGFSHTVDDRECFASVSMDLAGPHFSMPIKPSREHGSSMFIGGDRMEDFQRLCLSTAMTYASPTGHNHLVGTQQNDNAWCADLYVEVG